MSKYALTEIQTYAVADRKYVYLLKLQTLQDISDLSKYWKSRETDSSKYSSLLQKEVFCIIELNILSIKIQIIVGRNLPLPGTTLLKLFLIWTGKEQDSSTPVTDNKALQPGRVHSCNPSAWETEAGSRLQVPDQQVSSRPA